jgi:hypothetical protein
MVQTSAGSIRRKGVERLPRIGALLALSWLATACPGIDSGVSTSHFEDMGRICVFPDSIDFGAPLQTPPQPVSYQENHPAHIRVLAPICLAGSDCTWNPQTTCSATLDGSDIRVTSRASVVHEAACYEGACRGGLVASCTTPPLPAGTYQVRFGSQQLGLTVPTSMLVPCVGRRPTD